MINQLGVVADLAGVQLDAQDYELLKQPELSGIILFARNYQSPEQLTALTQSISAVRPDILICADQEGGRVQRFREGFTRLPAMMKLEKLYLDDRQDALNLAQDIGWLLATELLACGVQLSFTPVLDIERDLSQVIGDRAFGHDAQTVIALAQALIAGLNEQGMQAVGKHFPGHGAVSADSHLSLPIDERTMDEIQNDILPFKQLIQMQKLAGVMPAHVCYPAVDKEHTAGFSQRWLKDILRKELGFSGIIFSDDLSMAGAASVGSYAQRCQAAVAAGANALLVCNNPDAAREVIQTVREKFAQRAHLDLRALQPKAVRVDASRQARITAMLATL